MVVLNSFPNIYICQLLDISTTTYSITAGSYMEKVFSISSLSSTVILPLSADTVFIHSLTYFHLNSLRYQLDNTFEVTITFRVISSNQFGVKLNSKYAAAVDTIGKTMINVFIFNTADFSNIKIRIDYKILIFSNLALGTGSTLDKTYNSPYVPTTADRILFGFNGF